MHTTRLSFERLFAASLVALVFAFAVNSQTPTPTPVPEDPDERIRVKTDLVSLTLTVTDPYGRYVSGLTKGAFTIIDNNQEQEITFFSDSDAPVSVGILFDVSGSMNAKLGDTTRWKTALAMLDEVIAALPEDLNVGLRVYGHRHSSKSA
ncbi:MAG: hypothetical protein ABL959_22650, partial [Pyrinomonadaceae bacterium]